MPWGWACWLLLLLGCVQAHAQSSTETKKVKPSVSFSKTEVTATVGELQFTRPTLSVTDPTTHKPIKSRFVQHWSVQGGTFGKDEDNRYIFTDAATGTIVQHLYGAVTIGNKTGKVVIVDSLIAADLYKDKYEDAVVSYTINISAPKITASYYNNTTLLTPDNKLTVVTYTQNGGGIASTSIPFPTPKLTYSLDNSTYDVSDKYDYAYSVPAGSKFTANKDNKFITSQAGNADATDVLTITATPKADYQAMLGTASITSQIKLSSTYHSLANKLKTYVYFAKHEQDTYKYLNKKKTNEEYITYTPDIIVKDELGNDITDKVKTDRDWTFKAQDVFKNFSQDPHDALNEAKVWYGPLKETNTTQINVYPQTGSAKNVYGRVQFGRPDDYIITANVSLNNTDLYEAPVADPDASVTVAGQFYNKNGNAPYSKDNTYTVGSNQLLLRVHKRVPVIKLTPDPKTVTLAENYTMTAFNRFNISGEIKDSWDSEDPIDTASNFHYKFFLPDNMKYGSDAAKKEPNNVTLEVTTNAPSTDCEEWVPAYHNGVLEKNEDGTTKLELVHGTYYESWKGYNNEDFKMVFHLPAGVESAENVPIIYSIVPWNPIVMDVGISGYYTFKIVQKEPSHFVIDPRTQVSATGTTISVPDIKVCDQFGADISSSFNITRAKNSDADACTLNADGSVTSNAKGSYTINVTGEATSTSVPFTNPQADNYVMTFKDATSGDDGAYEIIYDAREFGSQADRAQSKMGKLHFIKEGTFFRGTTVYNEVPGVNLTFGAGTGVEDNWVVKVSDAGQEQAGADNDNDKKDGALHKCYVQTDAVVFNTGDNSLPLSGGFVKIDAITHGWLTVDANYNDYNYLLVDAGTKEQQVKHQVKNVRGEYRFPKPLLAGHSYYLYCDGGGMRLHGISFQPAFIGPYSSSKPWTETGAVDLKPVTESSAYANAYSGALPTLASHRSYKTVKWYCEDVAASNTSATPAVTDIAERTGNEGMHVFVNTNTGIIRSKKYTSEAPLNDTSRPDSTLNRVRIFAKVDGINKGNNQQVQKRPDYWLFIGDIPTYVVQAGEEHDQDDRVSTTNIPTRIWMTFGGWHWSGDKKYPYYKNNDATKDWIDDEWKTAKMDSVGRNEQSIDGFNYVCWGSQNPTDEQVKGWIAGNRNTFNLPVRGTYLKFEPEESGQLFVYLCQNGMTDNTKGADKAKLKKNGPWLRRRAVYIVDETGQPVNIDSNTGWNTEMYGKAFNENKTNSSRFPGYKNPTFNYYCDGVTRCAWQYDDKNSLKIDKENESDKYSWKNAYDLDHNGALSTEEQKALDDDATKIEDWWTTDYSLTYNGKTMSQQKLNGPLEVIRLSDGSFVLPTKGYVRYTFHVLSGKTYYVFATGSKLGFCGFAFLPTGFSNNQEEWTKYSHDANDNASFADDVYTKLPSVTSPIYGNTGSFDGGTISFDVSKKATEEGSYGYELAKLKDANTTEQNGLQHDFVNVTLKRTFRNQRWHGICLPFSLSETQVHKVFGDDAVVITFDSIMTKYDDHEDRTIHFTQHSNQLMEAGRPYFIRPNWTDMNKGAEKTSVTFNQVTFEGKDAMSVICYNERVKKVHEDYKKGKAPEDKNIFTYKITGVYDKTLIPWYSYFMHNTTKAEENKLYRIVPAEGSTTNGAYLPGMNVYLYPYSGDVSGQDLVETGKETDGAKAASFWITGAEVAGGTVTDIEGLVDEINTEATHFVSGVYNLQGQRVSATNNLQGLQPGIYIMGGKKYVVK